MAPTLSKSEIKRLSVDSFDVTCTIGTVHLTNDPIGENPMMAAMRLIVEHDAEGRFSFPLPDGRMQHVTVERDPLDS